ncbi:hypothetical protein GCM10008018_70970 [Paenibacillus marchantiophytorum]|uniref:Uncharacterized protein n=1 Tax=Paenibacillus marchantiophytorum TaxID=1619310 RepID=A0ABQ1FI66_9BACL|nr:hypothetical protein GCM10008018_70970 [Paenibacillus marchantiophytorum]
MMTARLPGIRFECGWTDLLANGVELPKPDSVDYKIKLTVNDSLTSKYVERRVKLYV